MPSNPTGTYISFYDVKIIAEPGTVHRCPGPPCPACDAGSEPFAIGIPALNDPIWTHYAYDIQSRWLPKRTYAACGTHPARFMSYVIANVDCPGCLAKLAGSRPDPARGPGPAGSAPPGGEPGPDDGPSGSGDPAPVGPAPDLGGLGSRPSTVDPGNAPAVWNPERSRALFALRSAGSSPSNPDERLAGIRGAMARSFARRLATHVRRCLAATRNGTF